MKHALPILSGLVFLGVTLVSSMAQLADPPRAPPPPSAKRPKSAPTVLPSASASADVPVSKHAPEPVPLDTLTIPTTSSARPTFEEWRGATLVELTRTSNEARFCKAYVLRDWLKVKCDVHLAAIQQHGGNTDNIYFWVPDHLWGWDQKNGGELMMQLRPGDRRIVQIYELVPEMCFGMTSSPSFVLDEVWIEGEKAPTVVLR